MAGKDRPRRIAIVHYHLRRGGVTKVVESAFEQLRESGEDVLILSGEAQDRSLEDDAIRVVPALNYRTTGNSDIAESLAEALKREALDHFGWLPDVWHFHNSTLAKNVLMPTVVRVLAAEGARVVLQLHDFPEDGRPSNYASQRSFFDSEAAFESTLYPVGKQVHYATINHRDHDFLRAAGVPASNLHVLPNAVSEFSISTTPAERPFSEDRLFALYPTRGIRRKNLGELLLLSLFHEGLVDFATSLSPENQDALGSHEFWRSAIAELELPITLGIADSEEYPYLDVLGWSDFVVTTSVAEGFGLAFLEPWMAGKGVMGRDLPDITRDFAANGLELNNLYGRIDIPVVWLDEKELKAEIESMLGRSYLAYDARLPRNAVKQTWRAWVKRGRIDFGVLSENLQLAILRKLKQSPELLASVGAPPINLASAEEIEANREIVRRVYGPGEYGKRLAALYDAVMESAAGKVGHLATSKVLEQFLNPSRLNLLRN